MGSIEDAFDGLRQDLAAAATEEYAQEVADVARANRLGSAEDVKITVDDGAAELGITVEQVRARANEILAQQAVE